jgi:hypothetical protein
MQKASALLAEDHHSLRRDPCLARWFAVVCVALSCSPGTKPLPEPSGRVLEATSTAALIPSWGATSSLASARSRHTATLLPNGKVLISEGERVDSLSSVELYDPASGSMSVTGSMTSARSYHTATLLPNGNIVPGGPLGRCHRNGRGRQYQPCLRIRLLHRGYNASGYSSGDSPR